MKPIRAVSTQRHRVNRVVNYTRNHLSDKLDLELMADVACLSKYHFARIFGAQLNETPSQFVTRLRLELAASKLTRLDEKTITQIALETGFSGSDVFSRSFRGRFGVSPRTFKKLKQTGLNGLGVNDLIEKEIYIPGFEVSQQELLQLNVNIERRPEYHVAYIRHIGPYGDVNNSISDTFSKLQKWAKTRGILDAKTSFLGRGADKCSITPARHCMYDVCIILKDEIPEDDVVSVQTIPAGDFATLSVVCESMQLSRLWDWMTGVWLPASGWKRSAHLSYEFFSERGEHPVNSRYGIELCLSVAVDTNLISGK